MPTELEQRARELLAAELGREADSGESRNIIHMADMARVADMVREGVPVRSRFVEAALRAIAAALQAQQPGAQAVAIEPEPDLDAHDPKSGELVAQWMFRNGFHELAAVVRAQLDMRAPRKAPPPLPEGVSELVRAVEWADKCAAALDAHIDIMPDEKGPHLEAWAATQIQMRRAVDDAKKRRSEFCARLAARGEKGVRS